MSEIWLEKAGLSTLPMGTSSKAANIYNGALLMTDKTFVCLSKVS
ncbi:hypothetical protein [uncultured Bartonella sp.]|nr:hypothetical protein [uncultured Bartonella sp.]